MAMAGGDTALATAEAEVIAAEEAPWPIAVVMHAAANHAAEQFARMEEFLLTAMQRHPMAEGYVPVPVLLTHRHRVPAHLAPQLRTVVAEVVVVPAAMLHTAAAVVVMPEADRVVVVVDTNNQQQ
jgi:hypothetical protein